MFNEYALSAMVRERLREVHDAARRRSLVPVRPARRSVRIRLGIGLIALGQWLVGRPPERATS